MVTCGIDVFGWAPRNVWIWESENLKAPRESYRRIEQLEERLVNNGQTWNNYCGLWEL